jgi:hypothetical protein
MPPSAAIELLDELSPEPRDAVNEWVQSRYDWKVPNRQDHLDRRRWVSHSRCLFSITDWIGPQQRAGRSEPILAMPDEVVEAIESSRWILELEPDWDESGSAAYSESTLRSAHEFVLRLASSWRKHSSTAMPLPKILPGPDASIDLHWKSERYELLANIPNDPSKPATFYGDDFGNACIRGSFDPSRLRQALIFWLAAFAEA